MDIKEEILDDAEECKHNILIKCPPEEADVKYFETFNTGVFIKQEDYKPIDPNVFLDIKQEELDIKDEHAYQKVSAEGSYEISIDTTNSSEPEAVTQITQRKCVECNFCTESKYQLHIHRKTNHPDVSPYKCSKCDYTTLKKVSITQHLISHSAEKPFKCENCDFRTSKQYLLNRHVKFHTEKNLLHCNSCAFKTNQKSTLLQHIRSHTGEKPYNCSLCEFTAKTAHRIKIHMMRQHSGSSPYLCSVCGLKIGDKTKLTVHMRTHSGEKPFACDLCGYRLTQKSSLVRHRKIHTMIRKEPRVKAARCRKMQLGNVSWPSENSFYMQGGPFNTRINLSNEEFNVFNERVGLFKTEVNPFKVTANPFNAAADPFNVKQNVEFPLISYKGNHAADAFLMNMQLWKNSMYPIDYSKLLEEATRKLKQEGEVV